MKFKTLVIFSCFLSMLKASYGAPTIFQFDRPFKNRRMFSSAGTKRLDQAVKLANVEAQINSTASLLYPQNNLTQDADKHQLESVLVDLPLDLRYHVLGDVYQSHFINKTFRVSVWMKTSYAENSHFLNISDIKVTRKALNLIAREFRDRFSGPKNSKVLQKVVATHLAPFFCDSDSEKVHALESTVAQIFDGFMQHEFMKNLVYMNYDPKLVNLDLYVKPFDEKYIGSEDGYSFKTSTNAVAFESYPQLEKYVQEAGLQKEMALKFVENLGRIFTFMAFELLHTVLGDIQRNLPEKYVHLHWSSGRKEQAGLSEDLKASSFLLLPKTASAIARSISEFKSTADYANDLVDAAERFLKNPICSTSPEKLQSIYSRAVVPFLVEAFRDSDMLLPALFLNFAFRALHIAPVFMRMVWPKLETAQQLACTAALRRFYLLYEYDIDMFEGLLVESTASMSRVADNSARLVPILLHKDELACIDRMRDVSDAVYHGILEHLVQARALVPEDSALYYNLLDLMLAAQVSCIARFGVNSDSCSSYQESLN